MCVILMVYDDDMCVCVVVFRSECAFTPCVFPVPINLLYPVAINSHFIP